MKQWKKLLPALLSLALLVSCGPKRPGTDTSVGDVSAPGTAAPFVFTRDSLPRLDGSTSTAPMAQAMCAVLLGRGGSRWPTWSSSPGPPSRTEI